MTKTRSQSLKLIVKKEEYEDKPKLEEMLHVTNNVSKSKSKITKNRKPVQSQNVEAKSENVDDSKVLLTSPKKILRRPKITPEQIGRLIGYVVNDKMNVTAAARKAGMALATALSYYQDYKNDPEHKIPLPKTGYSKRPSMISQQKINDLIHYIVNDRMSLTQAAKKADMDRNTAVKYYGKYMNDPNRKIPLLADHTGNSPKRYTKEEITDLIGYIVNDNMSVMSASVKANMAQSTAKKYYLKYLQSPNHEIPDPCGYNLFPGRHCTSDQVSSLIGSIVNDGMSLLGASVKANMSINSARRYYKLYLNDPEKNIPTPENNDSCVTNNPPTVDQIKNFFCYIIIDKLSVPQAACKANLSESSGRKYYIQYLNLNNITSIKDMTYSVEKMERFVELVQSEKMSLAKAADAAHLNIITARKHYQRYLKNPQYEFPANKKKQYTQEDMRILINYIEHGKMSICSAARKIKMDRTTAQRYYKKYQNDPEHKIPVPTLPARIKKNREHEKFTRIIAEIYKNNPSIQPIYQIHDSELDVPNINIKEESIEEDTKIALKTESS